MTEYSTQLIVNKLTKAQYDSSSKDEKQLWIITDQPDSFVLSNQISSIQSLIPNTATSSNQLADRNFVNSSINAVAAYYITKDAAGNPFETYAQLTSASTFYCGGQIRVPTQNDYCLVQADEQHSTIHGNPTTRYSYQGGTYPEGSWNFQYIVNNTPLTQDQLNVLNSGINASKVQKYDGYESSINTLTGDVDSLQSDMLLKAAKSEVYLKSELSSFMLSGEYDDTEGGSFSFDILYKI